MTTRDMTILTCDSCGVEACDRFPTFGAVDLAAWMVAHGWRTLAGRDLCPTCLMDHDAATTTGA